MKKFALLGVAALLVLSTASAFAAGDASKCTGITAPAFADTTEFVNVTVKRPNVGAQVPGYLIEARISPTLARLSFAASDLKVANVSACKDEGNTDAVRWAAYSKAEDGFDTIKLPIPKDAKNIRFRSCSNVNGAKCFVATFDGDSSKPVVLQPEQTAKK